MKLKSQRQQQPSPSKPVAPRDLPSRPARAGAASKSAGWTASPPKPSRPPAGTYTPPPPAPLTVDTLQSSTAWASLPPLNQRQVAAVLGADGHRGMVARGAVAALLEQPGFDALPPAEQAAAIRGLLSKPPVLPGLATGEVGRRQASAYALSAPVPVGSMSFPGKTCDAVRVDVTVGGRTVPVFAPADGQYSPGGQLSFEQAARSLAELPPEALARVSELRLSPLKNPEDEFWAQQYGQASFTTFMNCGADGAVTVFPQGHPPNEGTIASTVVHETGHAWSMKDWGDKGSAAWQAWAAAGQRDGVPPSQYGAHNLDEDLAETQTLFLESRGTPDYALYQSLYPHRFAILEQRFGGAP